MKLYVERCRWCGSPLRGAPALLPLGGEARFFDAKQVHAQCFNDMVEDWRRAGQWRMVTSTKANLAAGLAPIVADAFAR